MFEHDLLQLVLELPHCNRGDVEKAAEPMLEIPVLLYVI